MAHHSCSSIPLAALGELNEGGRERERDVGLKSSMSGKAKHMGRKMVDTG